VDSSREPLKPDWDIFQDYDYIDEDDEDDDEDDADSPLPVSAGGGGEQKEEDRSDPALLPFDLDAYDEEEAEELEEVEEEPEEEEEVQEELDPEDVDFDPELDFSNGGDIFALDRDGGRDRFQEEPIPEEIRDIFDTDMTWNNNDATWMDSSDLDLNPARDLDSQSKRKTKKSKHPLQDYREERKRKKNKKGRKNKKNKNKKKGGRKGGRKGDAWGDDPNRDMFLTTQPPRHVQTTVSKLANARIRNIFPFTISFTC
jgi:hypothetical protein